MKFQIDKWRMNYCYNHLCSYRSKEKPSPYGQITTDGKSEKCPHCGMKMTVVANSSDLDQ